MKATRELSLYEAFSGREISEIFDLLTSELSKMKEEVKGDLSHCCRKALEDRIKSFENLREDLCVMWSEMMKDDHWGVVRSQRKLI